MGYDDAKTSLEADPELDALFKAPDTASARAAAQDLDAAQVNEGIQAVTVIATHDTATVAEKAAAAQALAVLQDRQTALNAAEKTGNKNNVTGNGSGDQVKMVPADECLGYVDTNVWVYIAMGGIIFMLILALILMWYFKGRCDKKIKHAQSRWMRSPSHTHAGGR